MKRAVVCFFSLILINNNIVLIQGSSLTSSPPSETDTTDKTIKHYENQSGVPKSLINHFHSRSGRCFFGSDSDDYYKNKPSSGGPDANPIFSFDPRYSLPLLVHYKNIPPSFRQTSQQKPY